MKHYLVTGGCGFIGRNLIRSLLRVTDYITVLDSHISNQIPEVAYYKVDISNFQQLQHYFNGVDVVIHLAALSNTLQCINDPLLCNQINVTGTLNILETCRINNISKVVCASSHVVLDGMNPLRMSKIAVENYCTMYEQLYKLSVTCLRFAAVYGKEQTGGNVLNAFRKSIEKDGYITIFGDGKQERDFLHVTDCVKAIIKASNSPYCGVIDICSGCMYDLNHIATNLFKAPIVYDVARSGDAVSFNQSSTLAKIFLDFEATIKLEDGIQELITGQ